MNKYKMGDEVLVKGKINSIDDGDTGFPYRVEFATFGPCSLWFSIDEIPSLVNKPTATKILEGWNSPDTLKNESGKNWTRNVQVLYTNGTQGYGYRDDYSWNIRDTFIPQLYDPGNSCGMMSTSADKIVGWKELEPETPKLPEGWIPASTPPDIETEENSCRNVQVLLKDGTQGYGWHGNGDDYWEYLGTNFKPEMHELFYNENQTMTRDVIGWKELDPLPTFKLKVGDKIVHRTHLELGVGTVAEIDSLDVTFPYLVNFPSFEGRWVVEENAVKVDL